VGSSAAGLLMERLGLTEVELCAVLDADPLALIAGDADDRPELRILLALTAEAEEAVGATALARWVRAAGPAGRPLDLLVARDFAGFENALELLRERGLVIRTAGSRPRTSR
jgi:hypothetical protein